MAQLSLDRPINFSKACQLSYQQRHELPIDYWQQQKDIAPIIQLTPHTLQLEFYKYQQHNMLEVTINGDIQLECQTCLDTFTHTLQLHSQLLLTYENSKQNDQLLSQTGFEPIVVDKNTSINQLVSEEILLDIPFIPRCPQHQPDIPDE